MAILGERATIMERTILSLAALVVLAWAAEPAGAQNGPTTKPAAKVPDVLAGAVDPYNPVTERARFFAAAGLDNELDAKEFAADKGKPKAFVRTFDRWDAMIAFDKNANDALDWFEADAYRRNLRKRVLADFDKDRSGRLNGPERGQASRALLSGRLTRPAVTSRPYMPIDWKTFDTDGDGKLSAEERQAWSKASREAWIMRRWDRNKDGVLDEEEYAAREKELAEYKRRTEEYRAKAKLLRWDKNKDGTLDAEETAAMERRQAEWKRQLEEQRRRTKELIARFDKNGDGTLNNTERQAMYADQRRQWIEKYDTNGDGKIDDDERRAMYEKIRRESELRQWDTNRDGELDDAERAAMEERQAEYKRRSEEYRRRALLRMWDANDDGELDAEETAAMERRQARSKRAAERQRKQYLQEYDANGDGTVDADEARAGYGRRRKRDLETYDTNGDGRIDTDERKAWYEDYRRKSVLRYWDDNGDGKLDEDEKAEMEKYNARVRRR